MDASPFTKFWNAVQRLFGSPAVPRLEVAARRAPAPRVPAPVAPGSRPQVRATMPLGIHADAAEAERQRRLRRAKLIAAFDAAQPVSDRYALSGRATELAKLIEHVVERHAHGIIHGPRGSGKTSLARIFGDVVDEGGCIALYQATTGEIGFADLMAPYLDEIRLNVPGLPETLATDGAARSARDFAAAVAGINHPLLLLILDEFDRIDNKATRDEVAVLMKLLSDMKCPVRLLVVGIATTVDEIITAHPSLRRHLISLALMPISEDAVLDLIREGSQRAGLSYSGDATRQIVSLSMGSPYHVRLFCLNGGLAAIAAGETWVDQASMEAGLRAAYDEWAAFNPGVEAIARGLGDDAAATLRPVLALAARKHGFSREEVVEAIGAAGEGGAADSGAAAASVLAPLLPILSRNGAGYAFEDALAPQFLLLRLSIAFNDR